MSIHKCIMYRVDNKRISFWHLKLRLLASSFLYIYIFMYTYCTHHRPGSGDCRASSVHGMYMYIILCNIILITFFMVLPTALFDWCDVFVLVQARNLNLTMLICRYCSILKRWEVNWWFYLVFYDTIIGHHSREGAGSKSRRLYFQYGNTLFLFTLLC